MNLVFSEDILELLNCIKLKTVDRLSSLIIKSYLSGQIIQEDVIEKIPHISIKNGV